MRAVTDEDVLRVWERGLGHHPVDQALDILALACPEMSRDELAALSVGQRDARLLAVREQLFGPRLRGLIACPECQAQAEFVLEIPDVVGPQDDVASYQIYEAAVGDIDLRFRLPNSLDLAAVADCEDVDTARHILLERCLLRPHRCEKELASDRLPEVIATELSAQMADHDPLACIELDLSCPSCSHTWQVLLDVVSFLWDEVSVYAKRLLQQVDSLSRTYGWRESDILKMSPVRRQLYLGMLG